MSNVLFWIWLQQSLGYASHYIDIAIKNGGAREIYECSRERLFELGMPIQVINRLSDHSLKRAESIYTMCLSRDYKIITLEDEEYPQRLKSIYAPPAVLYVSGKLPKVDSELCIAIVGTRSASQRGAAAAQELGRRLCNAGAVVVSGCAVGIDSAAHQGALLSPSCITIGVLGCGIDYPYNMSGASMRKLITLHGALVSEYPPGAEARPEHFPQRNRIISGLSLGVAVIEAGRKSGSTITANLAIEQGRDLFAMPGQVGMENSIGVNMLIKDGAAIITSPLDILSVYENRFGNKLRFDGAEELLLDELSVERLSGERVERRGAAAKKSTAKQGEKTNVAEKKLADANKIPEAEATNEPVQLVIDTGRQPEQQQKKQLPENASQNARRLYEIMSTQPEQIDVLAAMSGLNASQLSAALLELELDGAVTAHPGGRYSCGA